MIKEWKTQAAVCLMFLLHHKAAKMIHHRGENNTSAYLSARINTHNFTFCFDETENWVDRINPFMYLYSIYFMISRLYGLTIHEKWRHDS